jgi:hypothetical protein
LWLTPFCGSVPVRIATVEQAEISKAKKSQTRPMVSECCLVHRALLSADLVTVEDEVKDTGDRAGNIDHGPCFRKIANDAPNGSAGRPNYSSSFQRFCSRRRSAIPDQFPAIIYCVVVNGSGASWSFHFYYSCGDDHRLGDQLV